MQPSELALLRASVVDRAPVDVTVTGCAYSCCGRGWQRRDYEQRLRGWIDNFNEAEGGAFMLYSPGIGTVSYVAAVLFEEVLEVT